MANFVRVFQPAGNSHSLKRQYADCEENQEYRESTVGQTKKTFDRLQPRPTTDEKAVTEADGLVEKSVESTAAEQ